MAPARQDPRRPLGEPDYGFLGGIGHIGVGDGSTVEGVVTAHAILRVDRVVPALARLLSLQ